ncbi:Glycosyl transferase family 2 [Lachnospiraceae bacterium KH1T2]|nr:Glycosyl transferase family 2 [Lachnospiraceae bacterium KH1T2]
MKPAIVIAAYNRVESLKRILVSVAEASYDFDDIQLIISIDNSDNHEVARIAEKFHWKHGNKRVVRHADRLGLKKHILECGDYTHEFGSIIMLEDDLYVSPEYYRFASSALDFSAMRDEIGGISLYNHRFNVFARLPFEPMDDGYDNWYFQFASSWGQAWTAKQWDDFKNWQKKHDGEDLHGNGMPSDAAAWSETSWLKYAIKYLIETDRYFLYPRISYTTNFADAGEHAFHAVTDLQVPLSYGTTHTFHFSGLADSRAVYDAYFENALMPYESDLYGLKMRDHAVKMNYLLSTQALPYYVMEHYGLVLRPMDANIFLKIPGREIRLYDLTRKAKAFKTETGILEDYFYPGMNRKKMMNLMKYRAFNR